MDDKAVLKLNDESLDLEFDGKWRQVGNFLGKLNISLKNILIRS